MNQNLEKLKGDIIHEVGEIEKVLACIEALNHKINLSGADADNKTAMAGYLMNFYSGIENIFKRIAKDYYKVGIEGESWHRGLLILVSEGVKDKRPIINKDITDKLYDYLAFRHFFIHGYSFMLSWENLSSLINNIKIVWEEVKSKIEEFINII